MKILHPFLLTAAAALLAYGCSSSSKQASSPAPAAAPANAATDGPSASDSVAAPSSTATIANMTANNYPDGYYTGFDGTDSFGLLVAGFGGGQTWSVQDPTVASITPEQVVVQPTTIQQLTTALTSAGVASDQVTMIMNRFGHARTMYKVTPLKAGNTNLLRTDNSDGGGFGNGTSSLVLLVTSYTTEQYNRGKARYATGPDAADPACASCHLTGKDGAPSHALGDINKIPDVAAQQWVTTGVLGSRHANIPHAWKFADADEELGTIAYVRSLEASDAEQLVLLEFAQHATQFGVTVTVNTDGTVTAKATGTGVATGTAVAPPP